MASRDLLPEEFETDAQLSSLLDSCMGLETAEESSAHDLRILVKQHVTWSELMEVVRAMLPIPPTKELTACLHRLYAFTPRWGNIPRRAGAITGAIMKYTFQTDSAAEGLRIDACIRRFFAGTALPRGAGGVLPSRREARRQACQAGCARARWAMRGSILHGAGRAAAGCRVRGCGCAAGQQAGGHQRGGRRKGRRDADRISRAARSSANSRRARTQGVPSAGQPDVRAADVRQDGESRGHFGARLPATAQWTSATSALCAE